MGIVAAFFIGIVVGVGVIIVAAVFQSSRRFHAVLRWVTNMAVNDFVTYVQLPPVETIWKSTAPLNVNSWLPPERDHDVVVPILEAEVEHKLPEEHNLPL